MIAGANRLNNGSGDLVALVGLSAVAITFAFLLWRRTDLRDSVVAASIYLLGLSLLLATSLRGWYITGHDIQTEYRVFQLTKDHGVWNIGSVPQCVQRLPQHHHPADRDLADRPGR